MIKLNKLVRESSDGFIREITGIPTKVFSKNLAAGGAGAPLGQIKP